ncbi:MAG: thymidine phosphorylase [Pirellulaceae bacterium]|jgi:pyrimidine-nucleoside phosphorylase|nr:thymidine phosphorylase [Pirellulaceae bacterium]MDP7017997.1 thymidine phosphorylase [Pirellulaceae bacterium]
MNPLRIIAAKRDGHELSAAQIAEFVDGFATGAIPDYQIAAWSMAVYLRGMTSAETSALTQAMLASGETLQWNAGSAVVDKHSTGGVGDKISLLLAPLLACCDVRVPMISGRGLGPTGGTLDKLAAIPGFRADLDVAEMQQITDRIGCVITGASDQISPADRKLYSLRDVTATVASIPLITASIMSKKLAEGLDALVLDVKCGCGAFMKSADDARKLADSLVETGRRMGVATSALITDMNQPLGRAIGNANEVAEAVRGLEGDCPADIRDLTMELCESVLVLTGSQQHEARRRLEQAWDSGAARERFEQMVCAQGGDLSCLPAPAPAHHVLTAATGVVSSVDAEAIGWLLIDLGGGRRKTGDKIDPRVGVEMSVRIGDRVETGDQLATVFAKTSDHAAAARRVADAIELKEQQ